MSQPVEAPSLRLSQRLRDGRESILADWRARVLADPATPEANRLAEPALRDHIPSLLTALARALESCPATRDAAEAKGRAVVDDDLAREHARDRARHGYTIVSALREIAILRFAIGAACADLGVALGHAPLTLLEAALDEVGGRLGAELAAQQAARAALDERRARLAALYGDVGLALTRNDDLPALLRACAQSLRDRLDAALARIWTLADDGETLTLQASAGISTEVAGGDQRVGDGEIGDVARTRTPSLRDGAAPDSAREHEGMTAFAAYPLLVDGRLVGVMALFARHALGDDALAALQSVATAVALGVDRRRVSDALRVSERRLVTTLESIGDAVISTDAEGRVEFMNPVAAALTGWAPEEARGAALERVFAIENEVTRAPVESPVARVLREGAVVGLANHTVLRRRDGTEVAIDDSAAPIRDPSGGLAGVVLVFRDVGGRHREERLRAELARENVRLLGVAEVERSRLGEVLAQAPAAIALLRGPGHVYELANAHYMPLVGVGRDLLGKPIREALPELEGQGIYELLDRVYASGEPFVGTEVPVALDRGGAEGSHPGVYNFVYQPLRDAAGAVEGIVVVATDVTAQVATHRRTELLAAELEAVFASAPDGMFVADRRGVQRVNQRALELFGVSSIEAFESDLTRRSGQLGLRDIATGRPVAPDERAFARALRGERAVDEVVLRRFDTGEDRYARFSAAPIMVDGRSAGAVLIGTDITEARRREGERAELLRTAERARREAEEANELKDQFLATVSHELRTPLSAMLGWLRLLRAGQVASEQRARALETVERNARAQVQLIEDLLDVSRIVAGKLRIDPAPIELGPVLAAAIEVVLPAAQAKGVAVESLPAPEQLLVRGDAARLQQVIWNLLANAVKFTPSGGSVRVGAGRVGGSVEVRVTDTGEGIGGEFLPHVFDRFRQADGATGRAQGGLGLGLTIVKNLVELHGGTVVASSAGRGHGATFTVRLPALATAGPEGERPSTAPDPTAEGVDYPAEIRGLRVLVLEDDADTREILAAVFAGGGAAVTETATIAEAMTALAVVRPDLVVSDIGLKGEDGYAFARRVRALADPGLRATPLVALTAYARSEDRARALRAGFNTHVPKPMEANEILAVAASLTANRRP